MSGPREMRELYQEHGELTAEERRAADRAHQHRIHRQSDITSASAEKSPKGDLRLKILNRLTKLEKDGGYDAGRETWKSEKQHTKHDVLSIALDCLEGKRKFEFLENAIATGKVDVDEYKQKSFFRKAKTESLVDDALKYKNETEMKTSMADTTYFHYKGPIVDPSVKPKR